MNDPLTPTWNGECLVGGQVLRFSQRPAEVAGPVAEFGRRLEAQFTSEELRDVQAMRQRPDVDQEALSLDLVVRLIQRENPEMTYTEALDSIEHGEELDN